MPTTWTAKDERQYEHIRDSSKRQGKSASRAKEIAARTVNKRRRQEGRTSNRTTMGTGNPNSALSERTVDELRQLAAEKGVAGRSKMRKQELIQALRQQR